MINKIAGKIVDVFGEKIYNGVVSFENGVIVDIDASEDDVPDIYIMPGFVNSHVHVESSMLSPVQFSRLAVRHGTVAVVSDPHEIANVMGVEGVEYMIDDSKKTPMKFYFGAPSCVPATSFETSGSVLDADIIDKLLQMKEIYYLSEMMNFPGVIYDDNDILAKIQFAKKYNKPIDGHAPGLTGADLKKYARAGITTDHESSTVEEAEEKIKLGIKLQIREGSAAKNFDSLYTLIDKYPNDVMLCTDDSHPDDLLEGHIDKLVTRGVSYNVNLFNLLKATIINPVNHYKLDVGMLRVGDKADFIVVKDLKDFDVVETYIDGVCVFLNNIVHINNVKSDIINNFKRNAIDENQIKLPFSSKKMRVITASDGKLLTGEEVVLPKNVDGFIESDVDSDILKLVVVNRYNNTDSPSIGFIKGFGLKKGAIAESIAHDSHNIIAVGTSDKEIVAAINKVIENKGAVVACENNHFSYLPLNIAGIMTNMNAEIAANKYKEVNNHALELGSKFKNPFMTLSFMALLVIPELKLGDKGLFKINEFKLSNLFVD